jgi:nanoRNase/pAp phosphatase (c-di-AMP/oligoRNAs hydrolase)
MVAYVDENSVIQCRLRREYGYEGTDLRNAIENLDTPDGGGHPGAVGFRFPADEIDDFDALIARIVSVANQLAAAGT